jgi:hypothetical protein
MKKPWLILVLLTSLTTAALAQQDWHYLYEQQQDRAEELFNHYFFKEDYRQAVIHLEWLLSEAPAVSSSYYMLGIETYTALSRQAGEEDEQLRYAMLSIQMYDRYLRYFGDTNRILNLKLRQAFELLHQHPERYPYLQTLCREVIEQTREAFAFYNYVPAAHFARIQYRRGKIGRQDVDKLLARLKAYATHPAHQHQQLYREAYEKSAELLLTLEE